MGNLKEVRRALANGADVNGRGMFEKTCLMVAVDGANEPLVSLLLQQPGIQVNAKDKLGWTALHYAAKGRKVIKLLLNFAGIDTEHTNFPGTTPLMYAERLGNKIFVEEYQKKVNDDKARAVEGAQKLRRVK